MSTILVINPNSTQAVTDHISLALQPFRFEGGPQLDCQTLRSGPPGIESQAHVDSISDKLLRWLEENPSYRDVDAWVLACFSDPGLFAMREVLPCPVIGCAEASYHAASAMADKFGVISILARAVPRHLRQIRHLGRCIGPRSWNVRECANPIRWITRKLDFSLPSSLIT